MTACRTRPRRIPGYFALWKARKDGEDTFWDSPWGTGRPGWHIECTVLAEALLGKAFDIHGGGIDLVFPHHENELAQSRALGGSFARIWAHNGMLQFTGEKMSKSEGNVTTIRQVLDEWGAQAFLLFLMTGHWHRPIEFSADTMAQAVARAQTFRNAFTLAAAPRDESQWAEFAAALDDDFDTPRALAVMHRWASARQLGLLSRALEIFGLAALARRTEVPALVLAMSEQRDAARSNRDFTLADKIRADIEAAGWEARDDPSGTSILSSPLGQRCAGTPPGDNCDCDPYLAAVRANWRLAGDSRAPPSGKSPVHRQGPIRPCSRRTSAATAATSTGAVVSTVISEPMPAGRS